LFGEVDTYRYFAAFGRVGRLWVRGLLVTAHV
jgi:hypothetical protein